MKKVGRVAIEIFRGHIRLRWTFNKKGKSLQICPEGTKDGLKIATAKAKEIDTALAKSKLGIYDDILLGASKRHQTKNINSTNEELAWNLKQIWEKHKEIKKDKIAISTQKNSWRFADKFLDIVDCKQESANIDGEYLPNSGDQPDDGKPKSFGHAASCLLRRSCANRGAPKFAFHVAQRNRKKNKAMQRRQRGFPPLAIACTTAWFV